MKTIQSLAVALALLVTHAHAQRPYSEPRVDLRDRAERAEDQRLEMLRLQKEANEELRRQTRAIEDAARRAASDELARSTAAAKEREDAQRAELIQRMAMRASEPAVPPAVTPAHLLPTEQEIIDAEGAITRIRADSILTESVKNAQVKSVILKLTRPGTPARPPLTEANVVYAGGLIRGLRSDIDSKKGNPQIDGLVDEVITCIDLRIDIKAFIYRAAGVAQPEREP